MPKTDWRGSGGRGWSPAMGQAGSKAAAPGLLSWAGEPLWEGFLELCSF